MPSGSGAFRSFIFPLVFLCAIWQSVKSCGPNAGRLFGSDRLANDDDQAVWNIRQWLPTNFYASPDRTVLSAFNRNLQNTFGDVKAEILEDQSTGEITCPSDLTCDFSDSHSCHWRNTPQDDVQFYLAKGAVDNDRLELYTGSRRAPKGPFLLTAANKGDFKAWLVSDVIPEQPGDGTLEFLFWLTPTIQLRVCTRTPSAAEFLTCSDVVTSAASPGPATVTIPGPITDPFELVFEVKNFAIDPGGVAFIDDVSYTSALCSSRDVSSGGNSIGNSEQFNFVEPSDSIGICGAIPCSFDGNNVCGYTINGQFNSSPWKVFNGTVGNPATGIHQDVNGRINSSNPYLLASGKPSGQSQLFVASSRPFRLNRPVVVRFYRHLLSSGSRLRVCLVDPSSSCLSTFQLDVDALKWQESLVELDPDHIPSSLRNRSITLLFIAEGLKQNSYIGIDSISVQERDGSPAC